MSLTIASPRPVLPLSRPRASSRRVKRSKMRSRSPDGTPGPSSVTTRVTQSSSARSARSTRDAAYRAALSRRLRTARPSSPRRPRTAAADTRLVSTSQRPSAFSRAASERTTSSRSTGTAGGLGAPESALARWSRSRTRDSICRFSASSWRAVSGQSALSGWARATSRSALVEASGDCSSWDASATKRRWRFAPASSRSSIRFTVSARRDISSSAGGTGTRRSSDRSEMASAWLVIASTGCRARPTRTQAVTATNASSSGDPTISAARNAPIASSTGSMLVAT